MYRLPEEAAEPRSPRKRRRA